VRNIHEIQPFLRLSGPKFDEKQPNKPRIEFFTRFKAAKHRGRTPRKRFRAQKVATGQTVKFAQSFTACYRKFCAKIHE